MLKWRNSDNNMGILFNSANVLTAALTNEMKSGFSSARQRAMGTSLQLPKSSFQF